MLHLSCTTGGIATEQGQFLFQNVPNNVTARPFEGPQGGLVLGLRTDGAATSLHDALFGQLSCTRFLASARIKLWWMVPVWGSRGHQVPPETQFLLTELAKGGVYAIMLPLIDHGTFRCTLRSGRGGDDVVVRVESGDASVQASAWTDAVYLAAGEDPFSLVESAVAAAASLSGGAPPLARKQLPPSVDGFGWCTWDAFYSRVSAAGVVEGLEHLAAAGASPQWLILDDGWQLTAAERGANVLADADEGTAAPTAPAGASAGRRTGRVSLWTKFQSLLAFLLIRLLEFVSQWRIGCMCAHALLQTPISSLLRNHYIAISDHAKRITAVEANAKFSSLQAGPDTPWTSRTADLATVIAELKQRYELRFVYAWHAMHAYWSGVSTSLGHYGVREQVPQPTPGILEVDPSIAWNPQTLGGIGLPEDVAPLHHDMHSYLSGCGVDGVKVDVQGSSGMFGDGRGGGAALSSAFHNSLEMSIARHFPGNHAINCMAHSTENLYRTSSTAITRASDDFYPRETASHTIHLGVCAYNSLFIGPILLPDWDMFHSRHPAALLHATARAASGGPVYVSDAPGAHDAALLGRLVLPGGGILRAAQPARPTADVLFCDVMRDGSSLLKVWNMNAVNGLIMVANIQGSAWDRRWHRFSTHDTSPPAIQSAVLPHDVAAFAQRQQQQGAKFAVYSDLSRSVTVLGRKEALQVQLTAAQSDILVVAPLAACGAANVAPIGLINMLNAGGAILSVASSTATTTGSSSRTCTTATETTHGGSSGHSSTVEKSITRGVSGGRAGLEVVCVISMLGAGELLVYADQRPSKVLLDGQPVAFEYDATACAMSVSVPAAAELRHELRIVMQG